MTAMTMFKASFACPRCGRDGLVFVESRLGDRGKTYTVRDSVEGDIALHDFEETSFLVHKSAPDEPIHYLSYWVCEQCSGANLAEVVFHCDRVESIEPIELTPAVLDRLH